MSESYLERMGDNPLVIGILIFDAVASLLTLINPTGLIFVGDFYIALGMVVGSIIILRNYKKMNSKDIIKSLLLLTVFGGIAVAISLTLLLYLLGLAAGLLIPFFDLLITYIRISVSIAIVIGILVAVAFFSSIKLTDLLDKEKNSQS
ncbi:MAG: hypothetical protein ACFFDC_05775 [Promethearchaeota archaeon]